MSVTVEFTNKNIFEGGTLEVVVQYNYGDYIISALHVTCVVDARNMAYKKIKQLEKQRLGG